MQRSTSASARNGKADGCPCCDLFELEDGKIKRLENNVDQDAWTAAWS